MDNQGKELRIGNLVKNREGKVCSVTQLVLNHFGVNISVRCDVLSGKFRGMVEDIFFIKLTPEVVRTIGFLEQKNADRRVFLKDDVSLNSKLQLCSHDGSTVINEKSIVHLHQLQNLYFLLTGTELVIDISQIE